MLPRDRSRTDEKILIKVDFPEPFDPIMDTILPGPKLKFRDSNILYNMFE